MKKKLIALLLCLTMVMIPMLAACGGSSDSGDSGDADGIKVGLICLHDENSTYDKNFLSSFEESMANLGIDSDHYVIKTNVKEDQECYDAAGELVDAGCDLIFSDSFGHQAYMLQAAKDYPDVQFVSCTGDNALINEDVTNFHNAFASIYEGRYLAGVAAGMKLNEMIDSGKITADQAKIGYVGAYTYAEVKSGYTSFFLGARSICPSATMDVTFTNSWYDETAEKEGANRLIQEGCVLISQHADSMGAPMACEEAGVPDVSYNGSTKSAAPNTYIISSRINWSPFYEYAVTAVQNGEEFDRNWVGTLETGSVVLTELNEDVAAEGTAAKLEEVEAALKDGSIKVFDTSTWTVDGETLTSYLADVEAYGDEDGYLHETEAISDGYFHESEYRAAPYFDIDIDGITLLD